MYVIGHSEGMSLCQTNEVDMKDQWGKPGFL